MFHGSKLIPDSSLIETEWSDTLSFSTSHGGLEEDKEHPTTSAPTSSSKDCKAQVASASEKKKKSMNYGCLCSVFGGGTSVGCSYADTSDQKVWLVMGL